MSWVSVSKRRPVRKAVFVEADHPRDTHGRWIHQGADLSHAGVAPGDVLLDPSFGGGVAVPIDRGPGPVLSIAEATEFSKDSALPGPWYHGGTRPGGAVIEELPRGMDIQGRGYYVTRHLEETLAFGSRSKEVYLAVTKPLVAGSKEYLDLMARARDETNRVNRGKGKKGVPEVDLATTRQVLAQQEGYDAFIVGDTVVVWDARKVGVVREDLRDVRKEWREALHPRDDEGKFRDVHQLRGPDGRIILARDPEQIEGAILSGVRTNFETRERYGGAGIMAHIGPEWPHMALDNLGDVNAEEVTDEQFAECERLVAEFKANPKMQEAMDRFGEPGFVVGSTLFDGTDVHDKGEGAILAAWSKGVIVALGPTLGEPDGPGRHRIPTEPQAPIVGPGRKDPDTPPIVARWAGIVAVMRHEYGHQAYDIITDGTRGEGYTDEFEGRSGIGLRTQWFEMCLGEVPSAGAINNDAEVERLLTYAWKVLGPISAYAALGGPHEAFAEAFAVVTSESYDRQTSQYPPETQRLLDWVEDLTLDDHSD